MKVVIVESPAKAKTLGKYLGRNYTVKASVGHVVDLPKSKLGVDIKNDFKPDYAVIHGKSKVIDELKKAAKDKADAKFFKEEAQFNGRMYRAMTFLIGYYHPGLSGDCPTERSRLFPLELASELDAVFGAL